jgi:hypothetical protein
VWIILKLTEGLTEDGILAFLAKARDGILFPTEFILEFGGRLATGDTDAGSLGLATKPAKQVLAKTVEEPIHFRRFSVIHIVRIEYRTFYKLSNDYLSSF